MAPQVPARVARALAGLRSYLTGRFGARLVDLRLFGSYARGDARPDSDVDVLVVVVDLSRTERRSILEQSVDLYFDHSLRVSPLALSESEYRELVDREYLIAQDIAEQGIAL